MFFPALSLSRPIPRGVLHIPRGVLHKPRVVLHIPRGVLQISSNGDDQRIFLGFEIFDSGIFLGSKIWQVFFVWLDWSRDLIRDFLGYWKQLEDLRSTVNKVQPNLFVVVLIFNSINCICFITPPPPPDPIPLTVTLSVAITIQNIKSKIGNTVQECRKPFQGKLN